MDVVMLPGRPLGSLSQPLAWPIFDSINASALFMASVSFKEKECVSQSVCLSFWPTGQDVIACIRVVTVFFLQLHMCSYAKGRGFCSSFPLKGKRTLCLSQSHTQSARAAHIITTSHSIAPRTHLEENLSGSVTQPCIWCSSLLQSKAIVIRQCIQCTHYQKNEHTKSIKLKDKWRAWVWNYVQCE